MWSWFRWFFKQNSNDFLKKLNYSRKCFILLSIRHEFFTILFNCWIAKNCWKEKDQNRFPKKKQSSFNGIRNWRNKFRRIARVDCIENNEELKEPIANIINILWAAFVPISFHKKISMPNCKRKAAQNTFVHKSCS